LFFSSSSIVIFKNSINISFLKQKVSRIGYERLCSVPWIKSERISGKIRTLNFSRSGAAEFLLRPLSSAAPWLTQVATKGGKEVYLFDWAGEFFGETNLDTIVFSFFSFYTRSQDLSDIYDIPRHLVHYRSSLY